MDRSTSRPGLQDLDLRALGGRSESKSVTLDKMLREDLRSNSKVCIAAGAVSKTSMFTALPLGDVKVSNIKER